MRISDWSSDVCSSDLIGDVATPKFGLIYAPNTTFEIKASWGTSFRAPSLRQEYQPKGVILFRPGTLGGSGLPAGSAVALVQGGNLDLKPERDRKSTRLNSSH